MKTTDVDPNVGTDISCRDHVNVSSTHPLQISSVDIRAQKVLQFQSRGTLAGISGPWGKPNAFAPCAMIGVEGTVWAALDDAELVAWLLSLRPCHNLNWSKQ